MLRFVRWKSVGKAAAAAAAAAAEPRAAAGAAGFLTPEQLVDAAAADRLQDNRHHADLLRQPFEYAPQTLSRHTVDPVSKRPVPLNVELLQYRPVKLPRTHGHKVALLTCKGYDRTELDRAAEFAARAAFYLGIPCGEPTNQRVEEKLFTVIRSPFAQAKSKENFKKYTYGRRVVAYDATAEVVDIWLAFVNKHKVEGVLYRAAVYTREPLDAAHQWDALAPQMPSAYADAADPVSHRVQELLLLAEFKQHL